MFNSGSAGFGLLLVLLLLVVVVVLLRSFGVLFVSLSASLYCFCWPADSGLVGCSMERKMPVQCQPLSGIHVSL